MPSNGVSSIRRSLSVGTVNEKERCMSPEETIICTMLNDSTALFIQEAFQRGEIPGLIIEDGRIVRWEE